MAGELKTRLEAEQFFQALSSAEKDECLYQEARRIVIAEVLFPICHLIQQIVRPSFRLLTNSTGSLRREPVESQYLVYLIVLFKDTPLAHIFKM